MISLLPCCHEEMFLDHGSAYIWSFTAALLFSRLSACPLYNLGAKIQLTHAQQLLDRNDKDIHPRCR